MARKEEIIESVEYIFENTKRIHGNSEALDWQKIAIHKSVDYILSLSIDVPSEEEIKEESLNGQINLHDHNWMNWLNDEEQGLFIMAAKWAIGETIKRNKI